MKNKSEKERVMTRRGVLPFLGTSVVLPFLGFGRTINIPESSEEEEYETLLKADGSTVRVRKSALQNSKVVKKNVSNKSLLKWLDKTF
jgi:hypothetical protein